MTLRNYLGTWRRMTSDDDVVRIWPYYDVSGDDDKFVRCDVVAVRRVPPHFSILPDNVEVLPGGSVNLTCVAVGSPMPVVKWRLGAVELTPEEQVPIGKNVLTLDNVRETATYTCVAASDLGNIERDAEVRVKGKVPSETARRVLLCGPDRLLDGYNTIWSLFERQFELLTYL